MPLPKVDTFPKQLALKVNTLETPSCRALHRLIQHFWKDQQAKVYSYNYRVVEERGARWLLAHGTFDDEFNEAIEVASFTFLNNQPKFNFVTLISLAEKGFIDLYWYSTNNDWRPYHKLIMNGEEANPYVLEFVG
jgi:hypothetical protein